MTEIESAAAVLGVAPDLPTTAPATPPPAAAPPPSTPDKLGQVWDGTFHESPPRLNAAGCWAKLRGNAARKAKGLPSTGWAAGRAATPVNINPISDIKSDNTQPPPVDPPASASQPPPPELTGAPGPVPVHDGIVDPILPIDMRPFEAYAGTAAGAVDGTFGVAQLTMGKAWELAPSERRSLVDATQRVLHHYQAPIVGPLLELILVLIPVIGKRRNDPETRSVVASVLTWWRNRGRPAPQADPYRDIAQAGSSAPAAPAAKPTTPAAYRDAPALPSIPGPRWIP